MTVLESLIAALRAAATYNRHDLAAPRVVLWPDGEGLWQGIVPELMQAMPELLVLNLDQLDGAQGPSTWLRYRIAGNPQPTPIVYLPGVARQAFRGAAGFPEVARHLYALQFEGQFWAQTNGKDWTPLAFLTSADGGLDLDVARDAATGKALHDQLLHVMRTPLAQLQGQRLDAKAVHGLAADDPVRMLLLWMASDGAVEQQWNSNQWQAFQALSKEKFKLDPAKDGVLSAAEQLVNSAAGWDPVWKRFKENAAAYKGLRAVLDRVPPDGLFESENERRPSLNTQQEDRLREGLLALEAMPASKAREALAALVKQHAVRNTWVWAELGEAPLASAVAHLANMLLAMDHGLDLRDWNAAAKTYIEHTWRVDAGARDAFAAVANSADLAAVSSALRAVYLPWLDQLAEQGHANAASYPKRRPADAISYAPTPGTLLLFVDGLRADLAIELALLLEADGMDVEKQIAWSALPTVTATAKPAWAPMTEEAHGAEISAGFNATLNTGKPLEAATFRATLKQLGWSYLDNSAMGDPATSAWAEAGAFDRYGHDQGAKLAWRIAEELKAVQHRIHELMDAGWSSIQVITDHGWLWMPGGLPKVELPKHLTVSKWGRCAVPEAGAMHGLPQVGWFWGEQHPVVLAPGISVFKNGTEYTHGGLSLQEALTPMLTLKRATGSSTVAVGILATKWVGLRLVVQLSGDANNLSVDLRTRPADAASSVVRQPRPVDNTGKVSLPVENDDLLGSAAVLVVLDGERVLAKQAVTIGEN